MRTASSATVRATPAITGSPVDALVTSASSVAPWPVTRVTVRLTPELAETESCEIRVNVAIATATPEIVTSVRAR